MQQSEPFIVENKGGIAWLTLNRPEKHNAMDLDFFAVLPQRLQNLTDDSDVRVVVIKAAGKSFSAGTDLSSAAAMVGGGGADERRNLHRKILALQEGISSVEKCCKPVIAAIHGHCIGGGVDLICACDIRIAEKSTLFSIRETRMGIIADLGTLQRLPRIIGEGRARELAFSGRDFSAAEAYEMGLITRVCEGRENTARHSGNTGPTDCRQPAPDGHGRQRSAQLQPRSRRRCRAALCRSEERRHAAVGGFDGSLYRVQGKTQTAFQR